MFRDRDHPVTVPSLGVLNRPASLTVRKLPYDSVPLPLPSLYHFQVIVTHGDTPSIVVTLPFLAVHNRPPPSLTDLEVTVGNGEDGGEAE